MKRAIVAIAALLAAACGGSSTSPITAEEASSALPASSQISMSAAPSASSAQLVERNALAAVAATVPAPYAVETFVLATSVNVGAVAVLDVMGGIATLIPPTTCAGDTCTWGPGHSQKDTLDYQLTVTKKADNDYLWAFQGRPLNSTGAFTSLISGEAFTTAQKHVGHGTMHVDYDAAAALKQVGSDAGTGTVDVTYKNDDVTAPRSLSVIFTGVDDSQNPGQKVNVAYAYTDGSSGGDVQLAAKNLTSLATLQLHTRWVTGGAGRGDAKFTQGTNVATESQCWAGWPTFTLGYDNVGGVETGNISACGSFTTAELPTIKAP